MLSWIENLKSLFAGIIVGYLVFVSSSFSQEVAEEQLSRVKTDEVPAVLQRFKLEDLEEFQKYYKVQIDRLVAEKDSLRRRGIADLETMLDKHPDTPSLDKVLLRLAELHYEQAVQDFEDALGEYNNSVACCEEDSLAALPPEPEKDFSKPLEIFQRLIDQVPESRLVADALYNKAFVLEELGQTDEAFEVYRQVAAIYPESEYVPDALMRMAEYQFNPPKRNIEEAIELFKQVLNYKDSPLYDAALYRLGWAHYKMSNYPEAIAYFTVLADDIERINPLDPARKYHFPAVQEEAIEYIAISFLDFGGADHAARFFKEIGGRDYGQDVFKKLGDLHLALNDEHQKAIRAYEHLLSLYPESPEAPKIQAKIALAYREINDEKMAYLRRAELFGKYRAGGEWWDKVKENDPKKEARNLALIAQRDNINLMLKNAEETKDRTLYQQAIKDSRDYLKAFPEDSNSVRIHWNLALTLDTKLGEKDKAFAEYIKISTAYWDTAFQKQAAENAVALMDEMVSADSLGSPVAAESSRKNLSASKKPLSVDENRLVFALNNYIKLFPHDPETPKMLAKAGALYYNHRQFKPSLKYFKTLAKHFPESEGANQARFTIMENYFGKGDFKSTELIARRLREVAPEFGEKATKRLAESIFFQAKTYAESAQHLQAAEEYRRVVAEVPNIEFAAVAIYNSGLEFDQAKEYERAIDSYKILLASYPKSEHTLQTVNNLAFDYRELGDLRNAASTYERLADLDSTQTGRQVALYNASVSYVQAEEWRRAIQVNTKFVARFPNAEEADELLFNNASYYLKLNDLQNANNIYASFASKYPDSPKAVEAFYHRGMYLAGNNRIAEAKAEFDKAIAKNDELKKNKKEVNDFYTSEALFQLADIKFKEFQNIEFRLPAKTIARNKKDKKALLVELVNKYTSLAGFGTVRLYESTYKIGKVYEEFAKSWGRQEIPAMDENRRIIARKEINQTAAGLYDKAVSAYKNGAGVLEKFAAKQKQSRDADADKLEPNKLSLADSSLALAENWIFLCKNKVSENLFAIAEIYNESLTQMLNVPVPAGMKAVEQLVYRQQVLEKVVAPITQQVVEAHARNLKESAELKIENQWTGSSLARIFALSTIVADELQKLGKRALASYVNKAKFYQRLVEDDDEAAFDVSEELANMVELGSSFTFSAAQAYHQGLTRARDMSPDNSALEKPVEKFMKAIVDFGLTAEMQAMLASVRIKKYEKLFQETENPTFEDAQFTYDDIYLSLTDASQKILKFGYEASRNFKMSDSWGQKIAMLLVKTNPQEYAEQLGFKVAEQLMPSSSSWLVSSEFTVGWSEIEFSDSEWSAAYNEGLGKQLSDNNVAVQAIWLTHFDQSQLSDSESKKPIRSASVQDSLSVDGFSKAVSRPSKVYFRKTFDIKGLPVSGSLKLFADDTYKVFVNGQMVSESFAESDNKTDIQGLNLTQYLRSGKNVIAIEVEDSDKSAGNMESVIQIRNLPDLEGKI